MVKSGNVSAMAMIVLLVCASLANRLCGQDGGAVDGAIWTIVLTSKQTDGERLRAAYRVKSNVLYQKENPPEGDFTVAVGQNFPRGKRTLAKFDRLVLWNGRLEKTTLKGQALLSIERYGEWSGTFIDSSGKHWECRVRRVQE